MAVEFKLYQKKSKLIVGAVVMAVFFVFMIFMLFSGPNPDSVFRPFRSALVVYPMAVAGIALTGYLLYFAANSLRNPKPRVVLSHEGVLVDGFSGRFSANWEAFDAYSVDAKQTYVLQLKDLQGFLAAQPAGRPQQTAKVLSERFGSPFLIETAILEGDVAGIQPVLDARLPARQA